MEFFGLLIEEIGGGFGVVVLVLCFGVIYWFVKQLMVFQNVCIDDYKEYLVQMF